MAKRTVTKVVEVPGYGPQTINIEVDEDSERRLQADPDCDTDVFEVLDSVDEKLAHLNVGTHDVAALKLQLQRLAKLVRRGFGIGTSPSDS